MGTKQDSRQLDYELLLLAHMICADEQIYSEELEFLYAKGEQKQLEQFLLKNTFDEVNKILSQDESSIGLMDVVHNILPTHRIKVIQDLLELSKIDGFISPLEERMIVEIANIWGRNQVEMQNISNFSFNFNRKKISALRRQIKPASKIKKLIKMFKKRLIHLLSRLQKRTPANIAQGIKSWKDIIVLLGSEYTEATSRCADIAVEDYKFAEQALKKTEQELIQLEVRIEDAINNMQGRIQRRDQGVTAKDIFSKLSSTKEQLTDELIKDIKKINKSLCAKQRSLNYFSIAFMGKTKSGKSTLHAIMTGQGWEAIGNGQQRTTRFNRVYQWENTRIIDTPGVGAAEEAGRRDEEIAQSIIDESDMICYVVTDDSIQGVELSWMRLLKENNKPIIVLLNVQNNLKDNRRFKYFLAYPEKIFAEEGESGLDGHISRIRNEIGKHYHPEAGHNKLEFPIIPVMLLAAQLSQQPEHQQDQKELFERSRIQSFFNSIKVSIVEHGALRKSQNLLGSTVGRIETPWKWADVQKYKYFELERELTRKSNTLKIQLNSSSEKCRLLLEQHIEGIFQDLLSSVGNFAEEHWNSDSDRMQINWDKKIRAVKFHDRMDHAFELSTLKFDSLSKEAISEVGTELKLIAEMNSRNLIFTKQDFETFFRDLLDIGQRILRIGGMLVAVVLPRIGGIIKLTGLAINWAKSLFKSKGEKRREAVQNISNSLTAQLNHHKQELIQQYLESLDIHCNTSIDKVTQYFDLLIEGLNLIASELQKTQNCLNSEMNYLNCAYAKRIIDACLDRYEPLTEEGIQRDVVHVERVFGFKITIQVPSKIQIRQASLSRVQDILQEEVKMIVNSKRR
jgi:GTP-binding protein EngB required for normal cell division/uncharacterized tellurite resistance protein B-like protein